MFKEGRSSEPWQSQIEHLVFFCALGYSEIKHDVYNIPSPWRVECNTWYHQGTDMRYVAWNTTQNAAVSSHFQCYTRPRFGNTSLWKHHSSCSWNCQHNLLPQFRSCTVLRSDHNLQSRPRIDDSGTEHFTSHSRQDEIRACHSGESRQVCNHGCSVHINAQGEH